MPFQHRAWFEHKHRALFGAGLQAGPAFIKWGQWAATRPDLFPLDLCHSLEQLQVGGKAHLGATLLDWGIGFRVRNGLRVLG